MKTTAYSLDLRERIINLINEGLTRIEVSKLLKISIPTIDRYIRKYKDTGNIKPRQFHNNTDKIKVNVSEILNFVEKTKDKTLKDIAKVFQYSDVGILKILKRNSYSFKKKFGYIKKEMKKIEVLIHQI